MIFDSMSNADLYYGLGEKFKKAFNFLQETDFSNMEPCRVEIDGDNIFAMVQEYETKDPDDGKWEAHKKYIDIQYILSGSEDFGFVNSDYLDVLEPYDEEIDKGLYEGDGDFLQLHEGEFVILFPHEAHMPCLAIENNDTVRKVVIKVAV